MPGITPVRVHKHDDDESADPVVSRVTFRAHNNPEVATHPIICGVWLIACTDPADHGQEVLRAEGTCADARTAHAAPAI